MLLRPKKLRTSYRAKGHASDGLEREAMHCHPAIQVYFYALCSEQSSSFYRNESSLNENSQVAKMF